MELLLTVTIVTVFLCLIFDFTNGFHDASSTIATLVECGAATPRGAVIMSSIANLLGALLAGSAVAFTMQELLTSNLDSQMIIIVLAAVIGSTIWNILTWKFGLPSSSTHALVGGIIGAGIAATGISSVFWGIDELIGPSHQVVGVTKVVLFLFISVAIGFIGGYLAMKVSSILLRNAKRSINEPIMKVQWLASGLLSFSHGANDTQKQMGIIALVLFSAGYTTTLDVPLWVRIACAIFMALGTLGGGWRIIRTIGRGIYRIQPIHSLDSQITSTFSVAFSTVSGAPVSSTQVVASSVVGIGAAENARMVHWSVTNDMLISWLVTIPATMVISGIIFYIIQTMMIL
jgi:PiT family inorganic phosphate transporter